MIIRRSIDKEEVKDMPKALFPGQIHVIQTCSGDSYVSDDSVSGI